MVTVYSKNQCPQCVMTKHVLKQQGTDFKEINIDREPRFTEIIRDLGYRSVPVVDAGQIHWSGFRPDLLKSL